MVLLTHIGYSQSAVDNLQKKTISPTRTLGNSYDRDPILLSDDDTLRLYNASFQGFGKMDSLVEDYEVFITGENHSFTGSNARIWLKMIKYLHAKAGVRNIMFEYGNSYGILVNEYLKTGDTTLYNSLSNFSYAEYSEVIKELKEFNDSLPKEERLYFTGIDLDRGVYPIAKALSQLLPNDSATVPDSIAIHIASIRSLAPYNDFKLDQDESANFNGFQFKTGSTLKLVNENFKSRTKDYKAYLKDNFASFKQIIQDEYSARQEWQELQNNGAIQEYHFREKYMHNRFLEEYSAREGNWFGQFGRCHTTQDIQLSNSCEWFSFSSLADRIEGSEGNRFKDKVLTVAIVYDEDRNFGPNKKQTKKFFNQYFEDMQPNSTILLDIQQDSLLVQSFGEDFNLLLLNTYNRRGEAYTEKSKKSNNKRSKTSHSLFYGRYAPNLSDLNQYFNLNGATSSFNAGAQTFGYGGLTTTGRFVYASTITVFSSDDVELSPVNASSGVPKYELDGYVVSQGVLYKLLPSKKMFNLMPGVNLGYSRFELEHTEQLTGGNGLQRGFLGNTRINQYVNDAFVIDALVDVEVELGPLIFGGRMGYTFDVSNKKWKTARERLDSSPSTSFTGWYNYFKLGLRL